MLIRWPWRKRWLTKSPRWVAPYLWVREQLNLARLAWPYKWLVPYKQNIFEFEGISSIVNHTYARYDHIYVYFETKYSWLSFLTRPETRSPPFHSDFCTAYPWTCFKAYHSVTSFRGHFKTNFFLWEVYLLGASSSIVQFPQKWSNEKQFFEKIA